MKSTEAYDQMCRYIIADTETRLGRPLTDREQRAVADWAQGSLLLMELVGRDLAAATTPESIERELAELVTVTEARMTRAARLWRRVRDAYGILRRRSQ